ncbi:MAG: hypothetical protein M3Y71_01440 [Actinomycetota bacterium]|nr:hypothetical protein [Actinomycetota bacterium]
MSPGDEDLVIPLPMVGVSQAEVESAPFAAALGSPDNPLGCANLWWTALQDRSTNWNALNYLVLHPDLWGDFSQAETALAHLSLMSVVEECPDDADIRYVKFIEYSGDLAAQAFEQAELHEYYVVTVLQVTHGEWKVWGISHNRFPPRDEVRA